MQECMSVLHLTFRIYMEYDWPKGCFLCSFTSMGRLRDLVHCKKFVIFNLANSRETNVNFSISELSNETILNSTLKRLVQGRLLIYKIHLCFAPDAFYEFKPLQTEDFFLSLIIITKR